MIQLTENGQIVMTIKTNIRTLGDVQGFRVIEDAQVDYDFRENDERTLVPYRDITKNYNWDRHRR